MALKDLTGSPLFYFFSSFVSRYFSELLASRNRLLELAKRVYIERVAQQWLNRKWTNHFHVGPSLNTKSLSLAQPSTLILY